MVKLIINKIHEDAKIPLEMKEGDACLDIYNIESVTINPFRVELVRTGLRVVIPKGYEAVIRPRSGLSIKYPNYVGNAPGTIDAGYRDEVKVIFFNNSPDTITIDKHTRIAQMGIRKVETVEIVEIDNNDYDKHKNDFNRGGGFGSTGETDKKLPIIDAMNLPIPTKEENK